MHDVEEDVPTFPFERLGLEPQPALGPFRADKGFQKVRLWNGQTAWLVLRHEGVRAILADNRFSVDPLKPGFPNVSETRAELLLKEEPTLIRMDAPDHTRLRRMLAKEFTHSRIESLRLAVQRIVDDVLDTVIERGPPADFYTDVSLPIPSNVICHILGVPYEDHEFFEERGTKKLAYRGDPEEALRATAEVRAYISDLIARREREPRDDLVTRLIQDQIRPGNLSHEEAVRMCEFLLIAGHETTANMLSLGTASLLRDRPQYESLKANPSLTSAAIEEMLRYHSIVQYGLARVATEDVELEGCVIRKGEGVLSLVNSANWDSSIHPNPEHFDIHKKRAMHVAFGFGVHQCLGQPLARLEMDVFFRTLPCRMPKLELAVRPEDLRFKERALVFGVEALPVTW